MLKDLVAKKYPKKFWFGSKKRRVNIRHRWAKMMKQRLDKDLSCFKQVLFSDECMLNILEQTFSSTTLISDSAEARTRDKIEE
jgi:hypothetical protein